MDYLTIAGILLAVIAVIGGNILEGGHPESLVQLTAFIIVFGGTLGATLVQTPLPVFKQSLRITKWIFQPPKLDFAAMVLKIGSWSKTARKDGLLSIQDIADKEKDPFARKALLLLIDGSEPKDIRKTLELEIDHTASFDLNAAKVYESMGGYSPTIGIIGAVLGLIHVMNNLTDPSSLGPGIAVAFVATIYGVGFANFLFLPMANKLKSRVEEYVQFREMIVEGIVSIAEGENPRVIETKLMGYIS